MDHFIERLNGEAGELGQLLNSHQPFWPSWGRHRHWFDLALRV